ncbi:MAG: cytochrome c3 family protein [Deltaproteobacteria bacterium]|nr:cytochrome c3 family protein [Deltaproteobacteria bacterium]
MRSGWKSMWAASLLLGTGFLLHFAGAPAEAATRNLVELHRNAGQMSTKECLSCHAGIKKAATLNKKIKTLHRVHLESKRDTPKNCTDCHKSVDIREGSAAALRKQVDPGICADCHSGGMKGAKVLFAK